MFRAAETTRPAPRGGRDKLPMCQTIFRLLMLYLRPVLDAFLEVNLPRLGERSFPLIHLVIPCQ